jgi:ABC-2 type transport system ATP-binding protein
MIDVNNVSKRFRVHVKEPGLRGSLRALFARTWLDKHALRDVSMHVDAGEIIGLLGANGAGKTTLVKICSGVIHRDAGEVRVMGHDPWERKAPFRRNISLIMGQKAQLWWDLPAADCFLLLREIYRIDPATHQKAISYLADALGVGALLTTQIRRLSLGERMKMELIAALLHQPRVVFLDEPTIGLDITAQRAIRSFILEYRREHNPAMVLTSHYMEDIRQLCRRIVILRKGAVVYDGLLSHVVRQYAQYKVVSARLDPRRCSRERFVPPPGLGEILDCNDEQVRMKIAREKAMDGARYLLQHLPVTDLNIEDEDISTVIEAIQRAE